MNKILIVFLCVLGLAVAGMPAYANPTSKKITLTCSSVAPDNVKGSATVQLCETTNCGSVAGDNSVTCPPIPCDTLGTISSTVLCDTAATTTPFRVGALSVNVCIQQDEDIQPTCTPHTGIALTGKGFFTVVGPQPPSPIDSDRVSLIVK